VIKKCISFGFLICYFSVVQSVVSLGDTENAEQTFQFSIGKAIFDGNSGRMWTFTDQSLTSLSDSIQ